MLSLTHILSILPEGVMLAGDKGGIIKDIHYDSRQVTAGSLFVCIPGLRTDGHLFAFDAIAKGAEALIVERPVKVPSHIPVIQVPDSRKALARLAVSFYDHPSTKFSLIGITGTNGKTSTAILLQAIMREWGKKVGLLGTIANQIQDKILPTTHTTPESLELQSLFSKMVEAETDYVMMEVSSHALKLGRVAETEFDIGIFTNLSQDHLDFHEDFADYRRAKLQLFQQLQTGIKKRPKYVLINADEPESIHFHQIAKVPVYTYGLENGAHFRATEIELGNRGISFRLQGLANTPFQVNMSGRFSVYNTLAAIGVAIKEGIPMGIIQEALAKFPGVPGRFEMVDGGQDFTVVVDYAHTPDGLENVLQTAKEICSRRIITVFGCGGDRDQSKRPLMGAVAKRWSDYAIITSDNPRTENPETIIAQIEEGFLTAEGHSQHRVFLDRREAIAGALSMARTGDLVLIAGKGHEDYQIVGHKKHPFSDQKVVKEILQGE